MEHEFPQPFAQQYDMLLKRIALRGLSPKTVALYSHGVQLRVADIDADRMQVPIRNAKGNRDRLVPLPVNMLNGLRRFWAVHRQPDLLFPSWHNGLKCMHKATSHMDEGGVQLDLRRVAAEILV